MSNPGYAVIGVYAPGSQKPTLMSANQRVIVFDTPQIAKQIMPLLGNGRICHLSKDNETATFSPLDPQGVNRAVVLTGYDPYDLPPGAPVRSETRLQEWKRHVMWSAVFSDTGQMTQRKDGSWANAAVGEE